MQSWVLEKNALLSGAFCFSSFPLMPAGWVRNWTITVLFSTARFLIFFLVVCKFSLGKLLLKTSSRNLLTHAGYGFDLLVSVITPCLNVLSNSLTLGFKFFLGQIIGSGVQVKVLVLELSYTPITCASFKYLLSHKWKPLVSCSALFSFVLMKRMEAALAQSSKCSGGRVSHLISYEFPQYSHPPLLSSSRISFFKTSMLTLELTEKLVSVMSSCYRLLAAGRRGSPWQSM